MSNTRLASPQNTTPIMTLLPSLSRSLTTSALLAAALIGCAEGGTIGDDTSSQSAAGTDAGGAAGSDTSGGGATGGTGTETGGTQNGGTGTETGGTANGGTGTETGGTQNGGTGTETGGTETGGTETGGTANGGTGGEAQTEPECSGFDADDTFSQAADLGTMTDCEESTLTASGELSDSADEDWYTGYADDENYIDAACQVNPRLNVQSGGVQVRACLFLRCDNNDNRTICQSGSALETPFDMPGYEGCCLTAANPQFTVDFACGDDWTPNWDATVRARIDQLSAGNQCQPYSVLINY